MLRRMTARAKGREDGSASELGLGRIGPSSTGAQSQITRVRALEINQGFRLVVCAAAPPGVDEGWVTH